MLHIPDEDRKLFEQYIFLPMVVKVLNLDMRQVEVSPFKLKKPYLELIETAILRASQDLRDIKFKMQKRNWKVFEGERDEAFTSYTFVYNGREELHNYFNPRIRNNVEELLRTYLSAAGTAKQKDLSSH
ncbi:hypothetical protein [Bacillus marinisedimentorum]|uniref:hypothetical protein n=1 Tax=Bacillus marinisedimentorum TaxID=1821260 RepID=UPI00087208B9|nr:hypothetical protein [Bacillus marinisedimentorum]